MKLYLISYPTLFKGEVKIISNILQEYDVVFHLRKPGSCISEYRELLDLIPEDLHPKIMVHGYSKLLKEYNLRGLHLTSNKREVINNKDSYKYYSTSSHSIDKIAKIEDQFDYTFLSPIFNSISKQGYQSKFDLEQLKEVLKDQNKIDIVALGGIDKDKIQVLKEYSFKGVAVLGAVWAEEPEDKKKVITNFENIYKCLD